MPQALMLLDQKPQSYPLNTLYFYLTGGCNLACRHCWIAPGYQSGGSLFPALDLEMLRSIIEQAKSLGLSGVKLTGGEPLLHPRIHDILEFIREQDLFLTVETNGILCSLEIAREIAACKNPFVSVSLDGINAETHEWVRGAKGSFKGAIKGIKILVEARLRPQIIMTLMRRNKDQIEGMVRLAEGLGADSVKFNILQPTARGEKMHEAGEALAIGELIDLGQWVESDLSAATHLRLVYHHPSAFRPLNRMFGENGTGCDRCGILGILGVLANGSYALCGIGETVPGLVFGHATTHTLCDIWDNHPILLKIREGLPGRFEGICGACLMKNMCMGGCMAQNYYTSGDIWSGHWYCEEALKHGLFPESRIKQ